MNNAADIQTQWRDDPSMSRAEKLHQLDINPNKPHVGQERVDVNMKTLLGGFANFRSATEAQKETVMRFKNAHDNGQVGGTRAQDYGKEYVDGGGINPESVFIIGMKARKDWLFAQQILGAIDFMLLESVVIKEHTTRQIAQRLPAKFGDDVENGRKKVARTIFNAVDRLAVGWDLATIDVSG